MKKFFTLIAAVAMAASVNAQTYTTPAGVKSIAAGTELINENGLVVKTVYDSKVVDEDITIAGKTFVAGFQLRIDSNLSDSDPIGQEKAESTPLVVTTAKKSTFTIYGRRQKGTNGFDENDNKDMLMINQSDVKTNLESTEYIVEDSQKEGETGSYAYFKKTYSLEPGTYTVYRKGSTMKVYGIDYAVEGGTTSGITNVKAASSANSCKTYNLAGQAVSGSYKGLVIKNGKKYVK